ncbi:MAG: MFS transporter [Dethiobacteria bacterium]|jgi:sugar phosphate permease|nr:MFS transporter [Bacillota bacterium]
MQFKKTRLLLWLLLTIPYVFTYFHRVALNVIADQLMADFALSATVLGNLAAIYAYMYLVMQIPGGALVDRLGPRRIASACTFLLGCGSLVFASSTTSFMLFTGRFLVGLGGSILLINIFKFQSNWFEENEFGTMTGIALLIGNLGAIFASRPLAYAAENFSWQIAFMTIGFLSIIIALISHLTIKDTPAAADFVLKKKDNPKTAKNAASPPVNGAILALRNPHIWPPFFINFGVYGSFMAFSATWGVPYLMQVYSLTREHASTLMLLAALGMMFGSPAIGFLSDYLLKRKMPVYSMLILYCLIWIMLLAWPGGKLPLVLLYPLNLLLGFGAAAIVPINAYAKEISHPAITGSGTATANMGSFLGIAVVQSLFGYLLDLNWTGLSINGVKYYPLEAYRLGLLLCLVCSLLSLSMTVFLKETNGENIYYRLLKEQKTDGKSKAYPSN